MIRKKRNVYAARGHEGSLYTQRQPGVIIITKILIIIISRLMLMMMMIMVIILTVNDH